MWEFYHKESWCQRIHAFELLCWRGLLRIPWTTRRSRQSILKEISPEYSLEGLILKHQYSSHLIQRTDSLEKTLESPLDYKEIQPVPPKGNQSWIFIGRTDPEAEPPITLAIWCEEPTHWKRPWCWERLKAGGEGDDRGRDGRMESPTWQTSV